MKAMKVMKVTAKAKAKAKAKNKPMKSLLKRSNLEKLGQLSLKDKVKAIAEEHEDEVSAAMELQNEMSQEEKTRAWNRHQKHLNKEGNEEDLEDYQNSNKKDKGLKTALFLMRAESPRFCNVAKQTQMEQSLTKHEEWITEKQAIEKWGEDDLNKHIESGRVVWRESSTWGVYEYMDTQQWTRKLAGKHKRSWTQAQEYQQEKSEEDEWEKLLEKDLLALMSEHGPGKGTTLAKGKTKGKGKGKGQGKNPNNNNNGKDPLPLEDMSEEEQRVDALTKLRKSRDLLAHTMANYEEALEKVKPMGYLSKPALKQKEDMLKTLQKSFNQVKDILLKAEKTKVSKMKDLLKEAVAVVKDAKDEAKELVQISMKTGFTNSIYAIMEKDHRDGYRKEYLLAFLKAKGFKDPLSANSQVNLHLSRAGEPSLLMESELVYPIHAAAAYGCPQLVRILLAAGADPAQETSEGRRAIDFARAANQGRSHEEVMDLLGNGVQILNFRSAISVMKMQVMEGRLQPLEETCGDEGDLLVVQSVQQKSFSTMDADERFRRLHSKAHRVSRIATASIA
ncbi:Uncharacterized protein SCF082_LOCUS19502 [Durusdinium trenchii]|uniref:Uncharacterized protein n=1 Tax=Durusdinium trenchii TaxID=1381693 RepID=A0ABP0KXL4_9DINO